MQPPTQIHPEQLVQRIDKFLDVKSSRDTGPDDGESSPLCADTETYETLQNAYIALAERHEKLRQLIMKIEAEPTSSVREQPSSETEPNSYDFIKFYLKSCQTFLKECREAIPTYIFMTLNVDKVKKLENTNLAKFTSTCRSCACAIECAPSVGMMTGNHARCASKESGCSKKTNVETHFVDGCFGCASYW